MLFKFGGIFRKVWHSALVLGTFVIGANTLFAAPVSAAAGINQQLNFQGRLLNAQGAVVVDGYYNVQFKIYQDGTGAVAGNPDGSLKWTEDWLNSGGHPVKVVNGYMSVQLGSINPFGNSIDWNQDTIWLSINIGSTNTSCTPFTSCSGDGEMLPMKRLSAVPYALNSAKLGGLTAAGFIQNTTTVQTSTNMAIDGTARADTGILTPAVDTNTAVALNIGTTNATSINLNQNVTVAANKSLTLAGGSTASRPASPTEGMLWYDTTTKQLLIYSNGKWQADRNSSTKIVAASNASQTLKDGADYVATGTGDQTIINNALTAAAGGKVYLTEGTYTINGSISIPNNTTLAGAGVGTVITIPNSFNADINAITNTTGSGNGTGITIQDLRLEGNRTNQTSGIMYGIYFNGVGSGSGVSGIQGAKITGIRAENWYVGVGISLNSSANNTISNNTIRNNGLYGISIAGSSNNKIIGNDVQASATRSIHLSNSSSNIVSNNTVATGSGMGISIASSSNNNVISDNRLYDNGSSSLNNSIYLDASDSNTITGNNITDTSATTTNYAINISNSTSDTNYLADNTLGGGSINDLGTGTIYAGQYSSTTNFLIQPASNITIGSASTITNLQGAVGVNTSNPQSQFEVKGGSGISSGTVTMTATSGSATFTTSGSITLNRGDWIVPTTSTSQAMYVATTATGTSFTAHTLFGANITAETFTVYKSTANFTDSSGTSLLRVAGNGNVSIGDSLAGGPGSALKLTVGGSALINGNLWTQSISNMSSTSNAFIQLNATGSVLSRNVADANAALTVSQLNAGSTGNILTLQNSSGMVASFSQAGNLNIASILDTTTATALNIGTSNATSINLNQNVTVASGKSLTLVGGTTASRPASPTEGMVYFDTTTKQLLVYSNGKWQSDRSTSTKIVAASNASQALKDSADYVATGTGDQSTINTALTAAAGGKVYLTEGTYTVNASISIPNNTTLAGAGAGTVITVPNAFNTTINAVTNTTTGGNGTGVTIQDLTLDGNKANQTSGDMVGIYFNGVGSSSGSSAVQGGKIINVSANNWYGSTGYTGTGIYLTASSNNTITNSYAKANSRQGIVLTSNSNRNTLTGDVAEGGIVAGVYLNASSNNNIANIRAYAIQLLGGSNNNTVTGSTLASSGNGVVITSSTNNTITNNIITNNTNGVRLITATANTISGNNFVDNGNSTDNNAVLLDASSSNTITGNTIADSSATSTNYAINISNSTSNTNYLSDNTFGSGTINDAGTGTVYANQSRGANGAQLTNRTANNTESFTVQNASGANIFAVDTTNSQVVVGNASTAGKLTISDGSSNTGSIIMGALAGNYTYTIPTTTSDDTFCLVTLNNCAANAALFIQNQNVSAQTANYWINGTARADTSVLTPTLDTASGVALNVGTTNASSVNIGKSNAVTTINGKLGITLDTTTGTTITCRNGSGYLSVCDSSVLTPSAANFIQNGTTLQTSANFWIDGVGKVAGGLQSSSLDTITAAALTLGGTNASSVSIGKAGSNTIIQGNLRASNLDTASAGVLTLGGTNATSIALNQNITVAANKSLTLSGGTTASRPVSPTEGMMWYDTTTKQLLVYSNGKWQSDSKTTSFIVAASDASQADKDGAQYVADGTADDVEINAAIAALPAGGGTVYLTKGTFNLAANIGFNKDNSILQGSGKSTVLKRFYDGASNNGTINFSGASSSLSYFAIDGNKGSYSSSNNVGIMLTNGSNQDIAHMWITNTAGYGIGSLGHVGDYVKIADTEISFSTTDGIHVDNPTKITVDGSRIHENGGDGIVYGNVSGTVSNNIIRNNMGTGISASGVISDNQVVNNGSYGIRPCTNSQVTGNYSSGNFTGIFVADGCYSVSATGNQVVSSTQYGIYADSQGNDSNTLSDNMITGSGYDGIRLGNTATGLVSGNTIVNNGGTGAYSGIRAEGASAKIINNKITDTAGTGYAITVGGAGIYLSDNTFSGTGASSINDTATGTVYSNQARGMNGAQITNRTANDAEAFTVQNAAGSNIFAVDTTNSQVVVGNATTTGKISLSDGSSNTLTLSVGALAGNYTVSIPTITANDTVCLQGLANCGSSLTVGALDGGTANANGMTISGSNVYLQSASASYAGLVNTGTQTFAGAKTFNDSLTLAAAKTINMTGSTTANRPASPTEGMMYYDTDTKQLLTYSNGKWQSDRNTSTKIVAASNASQALKDGADYVATGTNDQTIINSALTTAAGGKVYLTEGTFTINGSITMPVKTQLSGAGAGTLIQLANFGATSTDITAITATTVDGTGYVLRDLKLDGRRSVNTAGTQKGIFLNYVARNVPNGATVDNVSVGNFRNYGIQIQESGHITISNSNIHSNGDNGMYINYGSHDFIITDNIFRDNQARGLQIDDSYGVIDGNSFTSNAGAGIYVHSSDNTVTNNVVSSNGSDGIFVHQSDRNLVSGNTVRSNTGIGIEVADGVDYSSINSNNVYSNSSYGIALTWVSNNNTVSSNEIYNNGGATENGGILLDYSSSNNSITSNKITDSSCTATCYAILINNSSSANYLADNTLGGGTINDLGTSTIYGGQSNGTTYSIQPATNITMGSSTTTTTIQGTLQITPQTSTSTTLLCSATGIVSTCDSSLLSPTATNFIRNQNAAQQATANFWISGSARSDTSVLTPSLDVATAGTLSIGTTTATGITLGKSGVATTAAGGLLSTTVDATSGNALSLGTANASSITIGKSAVATNLASSTVNVGTSGATTTIAGAAQTTTGNAGNAMVIQGSNGLNGNGGTVTVQGGNANGTGTLGGNLTLAGGTGSASNGTVILATSTFQTVTADTGCFVGGTEVAASCTISAAAINNNASVLVGFSADGKIATMPDPSILTAGRVVYVTASGATKDFTLRANTGEGTGIEQNIAMRKNTTATMIWNGANWTAAGASSSTTLQAAYDNTLQSAGGAELVVSKTTATNGLTIRDSSTNSVNGALLTVQSSSAANLFSVNSNVTEYATDAGAEVGGGTGGTSDNTFPTNTWVTIASPSSTVTRYTTAGDYIATGQGSVSVVTPATANAGVMNRLSTTLTPNMTYNVSFSTRLLSGTFTDMTVHYSMDGTTTAGSLVACAASQTAKTSIWAKINCTFQAPATGITANNAILIRQATGVTRTFYVDNLSVTIAADFNYAADPGADGTAGFGTVWSAAGTATVSQNLLDGNDASSSAQAITSTANSGVRNRLSINPLTGTLYRVAIYAKLNSGAALNDFRIRYTPNGGTNFVDCVDYSTQAVSSSWAQITCYIKTDATALGTPYVYFLQTTASGSRTFSVDTFSMTLASSTTANVQIGSGSNGGPTTLFTLDKGASAPIAANNDALLGSMYYDTSLGKLQCYEADGWGACGSSPDNIVTISPEYTNAVLHGPSVGTTGVGTMTSDLCSDTLNINDSGTGTTICGTNETYNFYKWTSPQATAQTYAIYVTYQLPSTFKSFASGVTSVMGRTDNGSSGGAASVSYKIFRNSSAGLTQCGSAVPVSSGTVGSWQTGTAAGAADPSTCGFAPGDSILFEIDMTANRNANVYVGNLGFTFSNK